MSDKIKKLYDMAMHHSTAEGEAENAFRMLRKHIVKSGKPYNPSLHQEEPKPKPQPRPQSSQQSAYSKARAQQNSNRSDYRTKSSFHTDMNAHFEKRYSYLEDIPWSKRRAVDDLIEEAIKDCVPGVWGVHVLGIGNRVSVFYSCKESGRGTKAYQVRQTVDTLMEKLEENDKKDAQAKKKRSKNLLMLGGCVASFVITAICMAASGPAGLIIMSAAFGIFCLAQTGE